MNEKISIIIPVYNLEKYIKRTVESVLKQTYTNIEVIIVDDGSSDESWKIIQKIADKDNRVIPIHQENGGVTNARLNGVRHSTGEWIGFVDGDDEIESDMYEILLNNAKRYNADISHCGYQMIFEDGRVNYFHNTGCLVQQDWIKGLRDLLDGSIVEPGLWNKLFRKSLFDNILYTAVLGRNIEINEDLLMNYILFSKANISVFYDICKYHYLVRSTSVTRVPLNQHRIYDPITVKQIILNMQIDGMMEIAKRAYLGTCINVYNSLVLDKENQFIREQKVVRNLIKEHKHWIPFLNRKRKVLANLVLYCPMGYKLIYRLYAKYLLKNCYE